VGVPAGDYIVRASVVKTPAGQTIIRNDDGTITALTNAPLANGPSTDTLSGELAISVPDRDVSGFALTLQSGAKISGTVVFADGTTPPPAADLARTRMLLATANGQALFGQAASPDARGHFEMGPFPRGAYALSLTLPTWTPKSIRVGGKEVGDGFFPLTADVDDVVVTLTNRLASISGTVQRSGVDATVAIFPADYQSWIASGLPSSRARLIDADKNGTFDADGLISGDYAVAAIDASATVELQNPADIEALARIATRVTLGDGDRKTLSLSIGRLR
jgi:hypothetical protein